MAYPLRNICAASTNFSIKYMINRDNWQEFVVAMPLAKRVFDICVSCLLLILFSPFILLTVMAMLVEAVFSPVSRGTILYKDIRVSQGRPFYLYKFRIFKTKAIADYLAKYGIVHTKELESDPKNLTFTGKILKQIYMDELPQLLCVLNGSMTLVGPRPSNVAVTGVDLLEGRFQRWIFTCGITGPFQITKGLAALQSQNEMDMDYIAFVKNNSGWKIVLKDSGILWNTIFAVFRAKGI